MQTDDPTERGSQDRLSHFRLFEGQSQEALPCITRPPGVPVWGDHPSFLGQWPREDDSEGRAASGFRSHAQDSSHQIERTELVDK